MARKLAVWQHVFIRDMIEKRRWTCAHIARAVPCSTRTVQAIRTNLRLYGSTTAPYNGGGRPRSMTPAMIDALCGHLEEKPTLTLDEMVLFLWDEFEQMMSTSTISRALKAAKWSLKDTRRVALGRNADLRDHYLYNLSFFRSFQLVYVDESGCDQRVGFRRRGWSPLGLTPVQVARLPRGQRYQLLPAYTQRGILDVCVFRGHTDAAMFEAFIERLLRRCNPWPERDSVIVMDNASFHRTERVKQMCDEAGVKLVYLPPYSPDLNPIEEFFAELKAFIKQRWQTFEDDPNMTFETYLEWCVDVVGGRSGSACGHFRHAGVTIEEL